MLINEKINPLKLIIHYTDKPFEFSRLGKFPLYKQKTLEKRKVVQINSCPF